MAVLLGDARSGKLANNLVAFGRALRRAGLPVDSSRVQWAQQALLHVDVGSKVEVAAALEATFISREEDRAVFAELFDAFFKNPDVAAKLLAQMLPTGEGKAERSKRRARVNEALTPQKGFAKHAPPKAPEQEVKFDMAMTASDQVRLRNADFNQLSVAEYGLVTRYAQDIALPLPTCASRRTHAHSLGASLAWARTLREAALTDGEPLRLFKRQRRREPLPLLVLVDVSGSMERYSRLLLAFLHAATRGLKQREVFSFGNQLTHLNPAFALADSDDMLERAGQLINDYASGTQLGQALATLREQHARKLVGRRSLVLLISDGLDTGEPQALDAELQWLKRHCKTLVWLNPLLRFDQYLPSATAATVLHAQANRMLAVHNLASLQQLAQALAQAVSSLRP